jgi:GrpB-like predicted nucleotidyltransferase (UPF0157 family)
MRQRYCPWAVRQPDSAPAGMSHRREGNRNSGRWCARSKKMPELKIRGYPVQPPTCVQYDPRTGQVARRVIRQITRALPTVSAEHIGSTAVPGCAGKGIVDLMVTYIPGELQAVKDLLERLGFQPQTFGHMHPESRPMRVGALRCQGQLYRIHVHVIATDSPEAKTIRAFRERLIHDPELVAAYVRCKTTILSGHVTDPSVYTEQKSAFVQEVLASSFELAD